MPERPSITPPPFISQQVTAARRFYLNLKPGARSDLAVVCGGWEQCSAEYAIDRTTLPYFAIEFVVAGRGELKLGGQRQMLTPGVVFSYGPGIAQNIRSTGPYRLHKYFVNFSGSGAREALTKAGLAPGTILRVSQSGEVRQTFEMLIQAAAAHDRFAQKAARLQLELLLIWIKRGARTSTASVHAAAAFERCRQHIEANFRSLRTIESAAAACHIDAAYLTRLFRRFQDETPYRYLQRLQLQWAAEQLQSEGRLVKAVAGDLGIDPFQFSRAFKRLYGISPSAFASR